MNRSIILGLGIFLAVAPACSGSNNFASGSSGVDGSKAGGSSTGGSNTGGSSGHTGGSNAGGSNAGGSNAGGSNAGGSNAGGSNAGGSNAGGSGATGGGGAGGGTNKTCVGATCTATQVCVAYRTVGGGRLQPDGGKCPPGSHVEALGGAGAYCAADFAYKCAELVGCFQGNVTCACATLNINDTAGTCPTGYPACSDPKPGTPWLNSSAQLICEQRVP